jgi:cytochrome o ubiquinol oxidase subunit 2
LAFACEGICQGGYWAIFSPVGPIAEAEKNLILTAFALMLLVVIPVIFMTFLFAWRYRASNTRAIYEPKWDNSHAIEFTVWIIPAIIVLVLSIIVWRTTHSLTPEKPLVSPIKPVEVEVVALDWKWLFIYPEQGIASINELVVPVNTPINFKITSDTVMNSFFIPRLGGQIYAMAGMQNQLHLLADKEGAYVGRATQINGDGFSGMHFQTLVTNTTEFDTWVKKIKTANVVLNAAKLRELEKPTSNVLPIYFSEVQPQLFNAILQKYAPNNASCDPSVAPIPAKQ